MNKLTQLVSLFESELFPLDVSLRYRQNKVSTKVQVLIASLKTNR